MRVIGTAGHVDHGKSALVNILTGINPDRLREEQERQMTIDLGFAWLTLPGGESVGIVDVPGHRDFIENMLAGVGGIDAAIFVVAADEGVMPQTREHLAILNLLEIDRGVVALTKVDLVDDPDWLALVQEDVRSLLETTTLANAAIVPVSARTGSGLEKLIDEIERELSASPARRDIGKPRLSIDRAFTIAGFGTIVTGTLLDGSLRTGDEIEILPQRLKGRIRGLQTHKSHLEKAVPGSRVAVNISGVDVDKIQRGDALVHPGSVSPTRRVDVQFTLLRASDTSVKHNQQVKLFVGAAQRIARVRLLGTKELQPGQNGWLQLELEHPVVVARGDRYILRRPSPSATIGGGIVVDAYPERRHRRMDQSVVERLEQYLLGDPEEVFLQTLARVSPVEWKVVKDQSGLDGADLEKARSAALDAGAALQLGSDAGDNTVFADSNTWGKLRDRMLRELEAFHAGKPLRKGMNIEELRSKLKLEPKIATAVFYEADAQGFLVQNEQMIARRGFEPQLSGQQMERVKALLEQFEQSPYSPPSVKESIIAVGEDVYHFLISDGEITPVSEDVVFRHVDYIRMVSDIEALLKEHKKVTVAEVRDHFDTSRKYILALLEHLDGIGKTVREGDYRRLAEEPN